MTTNSTQANDIVDQTQEVAKELALLDVNDKKLSVKHVAEKLNEVIAALKQMQNGTTVARDRGPKSEKDMSEDDARRVMLGDLKDVSHKVAAEKLGLSYGQVYSARKGFTFKTIYKEMTNGTKAAE